MISINKKMENKLTQKEIKKNASRLKGWVLNEDSLEREVRFEDFKQAINFVNKVAKKAEEKNHHPDIFIFYDTVILSLISHKVNALTEKDIEMAKEINKLKKK